jgi:hypothetical protein
VKAAANRQFTKDETRAIIENGDATGTVDRRGVQGQGGVDTGRPYQPATRFTDPTTGRAVTVNNYSGEVIPWGKADFDYSDSDALAQQLGWGPDPVGPYLAH